MTGGFFFPNAHDTVVNQSFYAKIEIGLLLEFCAKSYLKPSQLSVDSGFNIF